MTKLELSESFWAYRNERSKVWANEHVSAIVFENNWSGAWWKISLVQQYEFGNVLFTTCQFAGNPRPDWIDWWAAALTVFKNFWQNFVICKSLPKNVESVIPVFCPVFPRFKVSSCGWDSIVGVSAKRQWQRGKNAKYQAKTAPLLLQFACNTKT